MDRRNASRVASIQKLQKVEGLAAPDLSDQNSIGTMTQGGFQEIADGNGGCAILFAARFKADEIGVRQLDLGGVFDEQKSLVWRNELSECPELRPGTTRWSPFEISLGQKYEVTRL